MHWRIYHKGTTRIYKSLDRTYLTDKKILRKLSQLGEDMLLRSLSVGLIKADILL